MIWRVHLERYNSKLTKIMTSEGGLNTDEEIALSHSVGCRKRRLAVLSVSMK